MSVATGDAPNFDMRDDVGDRTDDAVTELSVGGQHISTARATGLDDQHQAWSSALFPARSKQLDGTRSSSPDADRLQKSRALSGHPMPAPSHDDGLFVRRMPEWRPQ